MRTIKFRGKRIDNGEWVYGGFHKHQLVTPSPIIPKGEKPKEIEYAYLIIESGFSDWNLPKPLLAHEVMPETVGQFIGLHDSKRTEEYPKGQPIYEGDICAVTDPDGEPDNLCIVAYDEKAGGYTYAPEYGYGDFDISTIGWAQEMGYKFVVIGNIYETPELLGGDSE